MPLRPSEPSIFVEPYRSPSFTDEEAHAFLAQPVGRLISSIVPDNKPYQAVARRLGETRGPRETIATGDRSYTCDIWSIACTDWLRRG